MIYQPWIAHHYPAVTVARLEAGYWSLGGVVAMADYIRGEGAAS